jgi:hypothetical protein
MFFRVIRKKLASRGHPKDSESEKVAKICLPTLAQMDILFRDPARPQYWHSNEAS